MLPTRELSELGIPDLVDDGPDVTVYTLSGDVSGYLREYHNPAEVAFDELSRLLERIESAPPELARLLRRTLALPKAVITDAGLSFAVLIDRPEPRFWRGDHPRRLSYLVHATSGDANDAETGESTRIQLLCQIAELVEALHRLDIVLGAPSTDSVLWSGGSPVACWFTEVDRFRVIGRRSPTGTGTTPTGTEADCRWLATTTMRILLSRPDLSESDLADPQVRNGFGGLLDRHLSWAVDGPWPPTARQWRQALRELRDRPAANLSGSERDPS